MWRSMRITIDIEPSPPATNHVNVPAILAMAAPLLASLFAKDSGSCDAACGFPEPMPSPHRTEMDIAIDQAMYVLEKSGGVEGKGLHPDAAAGAVRSVVDCLKEWATQDAKTRGPFWKWYAGVCEPGGYVPSPG